MAACRGRSCSRQRCGKSRAEYCGRDRSKSKKRKRSRGSKKSKKCYKPGKITRNPFFNYLRVFRQKHCGWSVIKMAVEGAKCWCKLSDEQREKFYQQACKAPPYKRRSRSSRRHRRRKRSRSKRSRKRSQQGKCPL